MPTKTNKITFDQIPRHLASLVRGLYARVGRKLCVDPSYVSRVARGKRQSAVIDRALRDELKRIARQILKLHRESGRIAVGKTARRKKKKAR